MGEAWGAKKHLREQHNLVTGVGVGTVRKSVI